MKCFSLGMWAINTVVRRAIPSRSSGCWNRDKQPKNSSKALIRPCTEQMIPTSFHFAHCISSRTRGCKWPDCSLVKVGTNGDATVLRRWINTLNVSRALHILKWFIQRFQYSLTSICIDLNLFHRRTTHTFFYFPNANAKDREMRAIVCGWVWDQRNSVHAL